LKKDGVGGKKDGERGKREGEEEKKEKGGEAFSLRRGDSYYFALGLGEGGETESRVDNSKKKG
jgi:hypothetical protein